MDRVQRIFQQLERTLPRPRSGIVAQTPLEWLVATILSAQCTDDQVNRVTPAVFERYPTAAAYAQANCRELENLIRPVGCYTSKARNLIACGKIVSQHYHGRVPETLEALTALPGVGRKTANVLLGNVFGKPAVIVDTHVMRVAHRLGLSAGRHPTAVEFDLQRMIPRTQWTATSQRLLLHGRMVCRARAPRCFACVVNRECPWEGKRLDD